MNKNRYLLCLLLCGAMLYYAVPKISFEAQGVEGLFAGAWMLLALLVLAGNLSAYLYTPKKKKVLLSQQVDRKQRKMRGHS